MFQKNFVLIVNLPQKVLIFAKMLNNLLLRNCKVDKADTLHTHL